MGDLGKCQTRGATPAEPGDLPKALGTSAAFSTLAEAEAVSFGLRYALDPKSTSALDAARDSARWLLVSSLLSPEPDLVDSTIFCPLLKAPGATEVFTDIVPAPTRPQCSR
jgi:hypothetical protein